jgi:hypothetical protein
MPQHPGRPQVAFLVFETLRFYLGHRGRGVEKLTKNLTFEKMAAIGSVASSPSGAWNGVQMARNLSAAAKITRSSCGRRRPENASTPSKTTGIDGQRPSLMHPGLICKTFARTRAGRDNPLRRRSKSAVRRGGGFGCSCPRRPEATTSDTKKAEVKDVVCRSSAVAGTSS